MDNGTQGDILGAFAYNRPQPCTPNEGESLASSPPRPLVAGDIRVLDATPLPTSTDQCKNGGWRTFGVFKNRGDCVSFVATEGKNPPGKKGN